MIEFPPIEQALDDPNGLLASGGNLSPATLLNAYALGIFPWYDEDQPILWWSPDPRAVIIPSHVHISRSLKKSLRAQPFTLSINRCFNDVIGLCAEVHERRTGTWISDDMITAYRELHALGYAHSIEVWLDKALVGGLYGVGFEKLFCGESMFHRVRDASKVAFVALCRLMHRLDVPIIDCQIENPHLTSLGAVNLSRSAFKHHLPQLGQSTGPNNADSLHNIYPRLSPSQPLRLPWLNAVELLAEP